MASKKESKATTELKKSFLLLGAFFHKIADMPHFAGMGLRFDLAKPFDCFVVLDSRAIAIEVKSMNDFQAFGQRHLRPCQVEGLDKFAAAGGESFVLLNIRRTAEKAKGLTRVNRMYVFEWTWLKKRWASIGGSIKKAELETGTWIDYHAYYTEGAKGLFPLGDLFPAQKPHTISENPEHVGYVKASREEGRDSEEECPGCSTCS